MTTTMQRWVSVQDVFDQLETEETDRLARMLTHWVDHPASTPVMSEDAKLSAPPPSKVIRKKQ